jgi:hypothetical protein
MNMNMKMKCIENDTLHYFSRLASLHSLIASLHSLRLRLRSFRSARSSPLLYAMGCASRVATFGRSLLAVIAIIVCDG